MFSSGSQVLYLAKVQTGTSKGKGKERQILMYIEELHRDWGGGGGDPGRKPPCRHCAPVHPQKGTHSIRAQQEAQEAGTGLHADRRQENSLDGPAFPFHQVFNASLQKTGNSRAGRERRGAKKKKKAKRTGGGEEKGAG